jgi:radical SAM superfamily enzyme YgiQ (UPF0313 family)
MSLTKIALINPGKNQRLALQEPLSLAFIAGYLEKNGFAVRIIDELAGQDIETELKNFSPQYAGITATTPLVNRAYEVAKLCRQMGIITIMGGVHVSVLPQEALNYADVVVKGEGEAAMLKIIKEGITSGVVSCDYIKDLDTLPPPARHLLDMEFYVHARDRFPYTYLHFVPVRTRVASILTGRGCPYRCIFCHNSWRNTPYRFNSPERVISEIEELVSIYGIKALFFIEDTLFVNKDRLVKICDLLRKNRLNIIWGGSARVDEIDEEILKVVKKAGCCQITFGFESGSQRVLDTLKKGTTVEQNAKAIKLCRKFGIIPQGSFMVGNPMETIEDVLATQRFIKRNNIGGVVVCVTTVYPGTGLWKWCEERNLIPPNLSWSDLLYDRAVIPCCEQFSCEDIEALFRQTAKIADLKWPIQLSEFLNICFMPLWKLPRRIVKAITQPFYIFELIRLLKKLRL